MTAGMILSSADILRILGRNEVIRLSAQVSIVDGKPALSGREGIHIYVNRFPALEEFEATWQIWIESDEEDDLIIAELQRLLPRVQVTRGLMTTVSTTEFRSDNTQKAPEAPKAAQAQVDMSAFEDRFQALVEDVQDRMLLVTSGRPGKDGRDGRPGEPGRPGRDILATETNLEDLANVDQVIPKQDGQVLTWKNGTWQNLFAAEVIPAYGGGGAGGGDAGSGSGINGSEWRFSTQTTGSPANGYFFINDADPSLATEIYISEKNKDGKDLSLFLYELIQPGTKIFAQDSSDSDNAFVYSAISSPIDNGTFLTVLVSHEGSSGSISNNKVSIVSLIGGGGAGSVSVIDDLLDVDTSTTAPQVGDILKWDGSQWVPDATAGTGIEEAPVDGKYYLRQNGAWVDLATALTQVVTPDTNVDGADFTQQVTTAVNSIIYDGGDFTSGGSVATDNTFLDGEVFSPAFDDTVIDGGNASV